MPFPLIMAGAALVGGAYSVGRPFLHRYLQKQRPEIEAWAMRNALEAIGLPDLMDEGLTRESFTGAINQSLMAGSDIQFRNVFDAEGIKSDVEKYALKKAAIELGIELKDATIKGMRDALGDWVRAQVREQIDAGEGDLIDGAKDLSRVLVIIKAVRKGLDENGQPLPEPELLMTPEAISNRERQARYRASHTRHWEDR